MCRFFRFSLRLVLVSAGLLVLSGRLVQAEDSFYRTFQTPRFILYIGQHNLIEADSEVNVVDHDELAQHSLALLDATYDEFSRIFKKKPERKVVLRFLSPDQFREQTGAPAWTSAMYYRDEITIPLHQERGVNLPELGRALRHEYVHAVIAEVSEYRCPAWLDEGVAQLLEGPANPLLGPALREWVETNPAIPLDWLQNGFTLLDSAFVPAAYAQSLFATRKLVNELGFSSIVNYLERLERGISEPLAFEQAFGQTKREFEAELTTAMRLWAVSRNENP